MNEHEPELSRIYLLRHGETAWSLSRQLTGRADIPLTARGETAARELAPALRSCDFATVLVSPLQRARQTAQLAGVWDQAQVDANLTEWDYGEYEGRRTADVQASRPGWNLFEDGCPGGEGLNEVDTRALAVIHRVKALDKNVLAVAHRDILRVIIARWLGLAPLEARRFYLDTASISILGYHPSREEPVIRTLNVTVDGLHR